MVEGADEGENDDVRRGGGNDEATCLKWKLLMKSKPFQGTNVFAKTKFKKGKGKTKNGGAKSRTWKGHGRQDWSDSSQLKMEQFFGVRSKGNSPGSSQT